MGFLRFAVWPMILGTAAVFTLLVAVYEWLGGTAFSDYQTGFQTARLDGRLDNEGVYPRG